MWNITLKCVKIAHTHFCVIFHTFRQMCEISHKMCEISHITLKNCEIFHTFLKCVKYHTLVLKFQLKHCVTFHTICVIIHAFFGMCEISHKNVCRRFSHIYVWYFTHLTIISERVCTVSIKFFRFLLMVPYPTHSVL